MISVSSSSFLLRFFFLSRVEYYILDRNCDFDRIIASSVSRFYRMKIGQENIISEENRTAHTRFITFFGDKVKDPRSIIIFSLML
jgi:hypothetical protein